MTVEGRQSAWTPAIFLLGLLVAGCFGPTPPICHGSSEVDRFLTSDATADEIATVFAHHGWTQVPPEAGFDVQASLVWNKTTSLRAAAGRMVATSSTGEAYAKPWQVAFAGLDQTRADWGHVTDLEAILAPLLRDLEGLGRIDQPAGYSWFRLAGSGSAWECIHPD